MYEELNMYRYSEIEIDKSFSIFIMLSMIN